MLFAIERELSEADDEKTLVARRERSLPVVEDFFSFCQKQWFEKVVDRTSLLGKVN